MALRDVRILLPQSEQYTNAKGGKAVLAFSAINQSSSRNDELVSVTTDLGQVKITPEKPQLAPGQTVVADGAAKAGEAASAPTSAAAPTTEPGHGATEAGEGAGTADRPADPYAHPILVEITGLTKDVVPGLTYGVTFNFKDAGTVAVQVPVDAGPDTPRHESATIAEHKGH